MIRFLLLTAEDTWQSLIGDIGFPAAVCIYLLRVNAKQTTAINKLTVAIKRLARRLGDELEEDQ